MDDEKRPFTPTPRRLHQETDQTLLWLVIFTLVVVGGGLIALIYGGSSLLTAVPCLLAGAGLILVPWWVLTLLERWRNRMEQEDWDALDHDSGEES
jgi:protein-S-isoprenylcysteine O-methyltransferase Ste14